jgi:DNA modification methylase
MDNYLSWLSQRVKECYRLLKEDGTLWVQCDDTAQAYIQVALDKIFNYHNRMDTIAVKRHVSEAHLSQKNCPRNLDILFRYVKSSSSNFTWNTPKREMTKEEIDRKIKRKEWKVEKSTGRYYDTQPITRSNNDYNKHETRTFYYPDGTPIVLTTNIGWSWSQQKIEDEWKNDPHIFHFTKNKITKEVTSVRIRQYKSTSKILSNIWSHEPVMIPSTSKESVGYPTQKSESFLKILVKASSNPGDIILDLFGGSGSMLAVANQLQRKCLSIEIKDDACKLIKKRLIHSSLKYYELDPFLTNLVEKPVATISLDKFIK